MTKLIPDIWESSFDFHLLQMKHTFLSSVKLSTELVLQVYTGIGPDFLDCAPDVSGLGLAQTVAVAFCFDLLSVLSLPFVFCQILFPLVIFAS